MTKYQHKSSGLEPTVIYPFVSRAFTLPYTPGQSNTLTLAKPAKLTIEVFQGLNAYDDKDPSLDSAYKEPGAPPYLTVTGPVGTPNTANLIQTINVTLPAGTFPQPNLATAVSTNSTVPANGTNAAWGFDMRIPTTNATQASDIITKDDVVRTVSLKHGDARIVAATNTVPDTLYTGDAKYGSSAATDMRFHYFFDNTPVDGYSAKGKLVTAGGFVIPYPVNTDVNYCKYGDFDGPNLRITAGAFVGTQNVSSLGALINKPDEGDNQILGNGVTSNIPYYGFNQSTTTNINEYTPNRIMPSPGMFGSLPTHVKQNIASNGDDGSWQTLLFRPQPNHPDATTSPKDHLIMDLFWMPVVEPYAISEPFSTMGKINLNYQIVPFTYMTRSTALICLMQNEKITANPPTGADAKTKFRLDINTSETGGTLQQFKEKFAKGDIFRSPTEICDMDLVPLTDPFGVAQTWSASWGSSFWTKNSTTGDNVRERPYTNLYARLTTKSNTYTVHFRVQALQKVPSSAPGQWDSAKDQIVSEYRGSSIVERYIDANDTTIAADVLSSTSASLDTYYKFRVIGTKKFSP